jgi:hypothetical protein
MELDAPQKCCLSLTKMLPFSDACGHRKQHFLAHGATCVTEIFSIVQAAPRIAFLVFKKTKKIIKTLKKIL